MTHSKSYYVTRGIVRAIVWTALLTVAVSIGIASIWVLWAVAG